MHNIESNVLEGTLLQGILASYVVASLDYPLLGCCY